MPLREQELAILGQVEQGGENKMISRYDPDYLTSDIKEIYTSTDGSIKTMEYIIKSPINEIGADIIIIDEFDLDREYFKPMEAEK